MKDQTNGDSMWFGILNQTNTNYTRTQGTSVWYDQTDGYQTDAICIKDGASSGMYINSATLVAPVSNTGDIYPIDLLYVSDF